MASNSKQILRVPISISAKSPAELSRKCLENNMRFQTEFNYYQISKVGSDWIAWFYADVSKYPFLKKQEPKPAPVEAE